MTREQFAEVVSMLVVCIEAPAWVREHRLTPRQAWMRCRRSDWMLFVVLIFAFRGGGEVRAREWQRYFCALWGDRPSRWSELDPGPNPTPTEIRRAVPWPMVRDAFEREARKMGVIQ